MIKWDHNPANGFINGYFVVVAEALFRRQAVAQGDPRRPDQILPGLGDVGAAAGRGVLGSAGIRMAYLLCRAGYRLLLF